MPLTPVASIALSFIGGSLAVSLPTMVYARYKLRQLRKQAAEPTIVADEVVVD